MSEQLFLFAVISLFRPSYHIVVPFICKQCGKCCDPMPVGIWSKIAVLRVAEHLGFKRTPEDIVKFKKKYLGSVEEKGEGGIRYATCPFLTEDKKCSIYRVRPEGCAYYPLATDFGVADVDCPAKKRIDKIIKIIRRQKPFVMGSDAETLEKIKELRDKGMGSFFSPKPDEKQWSRALKKYLQTNPSDEELQLFKKLNFRGT